MEPKCNNLIEVCCLKLQIDPLYLAIAGLKLMEHYGSTTPYLFYEIQTI